MSESVGTLMVHIAGDISALRQATEQANQHAAQAAKSIADQFGRTMRSINGSLGESGRELMEFSRGVKDTFGADASGAAKAFGAAVSNATGVSRESFLRLGEAAKATKDSFEMAAGAARLIASPVALVATTLLLVVAAVGLVRREWRGWSDEVKALGSPVGYIAEKWGDLKVAFGGAPPPASGGGAASGGGITAGAAAKAFGADVSAGLKEFGIDLDALTKMFGPSADAIKAETAARKLKTEAGAEDAQKIAEWRMRQWAEEQAAGAAFIAAREIEAASWEAANAKLIAGLNEANEATRKANEATRKATAEKEAAKEAAKGAALGGQILGATGKGGQLAAAALGPAGPAGAVVELIAMSKGFIATIQRMDGAIQLVADSIGVVFEVFQPLIDPVITALKALAPALRILTLIGVAPLILILAPLLLTLKLIEPAFGLLGRALTALWNWINGLLSKVGLGAGSSAGSSASANAAVAGVFASWKAVADQDRAARDAALEADRAEKEAKEAELEATRNKTKADKDATRAIKEFAESLTNMPSGFKVARSRFSATEAAESLADAVARVLQRRAYVATGSPFGGG